MAITITETFTVDGVLTDLDANPKLSDPDDVYGIKRNDTDGVVVADGTAFDGHPADGTYTYSFDEPAVNLSYTYWVEWVYNSITYWDEHTIGAAGEGTALSDLKTICQYHGWHDTTTTGLAALTNFINRTLQILSRLGPWPEYHKRDGTISVVADDEDYTLSEANIQQLGNIVRANWTTPLEIIIGGLDEWLLKVKSTGATGKPTEYAVSKSVNASGEIITEVLVYPKPTASETLYYCYRLLPTKLVNDSDVCDWPDSRLWLLDEALSVRIKSANRDTVGVALEGADFMANVRLALSDTRTSYMPLPIEPLIDKRHRSIRKIPIQTI